MRTSSVLTLLPFYTRRGLRPQVFDFEINIKEDIAKMVEMCGRYLKLENQALIVRAAGYFSYWV